MDTIDIQHNPSPKMRYEITLKIRNAPGPFESIHGYALFEIANEKCAPFDKFAGVHLKPSAQTQLFSLTRVSNDKYKGFVYLDYLKDEDYYSLGPCHWKMTGGGVRIKAKTTEYIAGISTDEIISQQSTTTHLWKQAYYSSSENDHMGNNTSSDNMVKLHPEKFFAATLSAKESFE